MKQIDRDIARAMMEGRTMTVGDTLVYPSVDELGIMVYKGNVVAVYNKRSRRAIFSVCGRNTRMTRRRINSLLMALEGTGVTRGLGKLWFVPTCGSPWAIDKNKWYDDKGKEVVG